MVYHSHMLNPRAFLEDSLRYGARQFWTAGFPWEHVNRAIDTSFSYNVPDDTKAIWTAHTGCAWDNTQDRLEKLVRCGVCGGDVPIPWTTCGLDENPKTAE
jgi:hypothetical protein